MADLVETNEYPTGIYQLEQTDPVLGGAPNEATMAGIDNIPHQQLAKRTNWLKARVDTLVETVVAATTAVAGIVRLSTSTSSTSTTMAATPSAVKAAMDNANTRALQAVTLTADDGLDGGGDLSGHRSFSVDATVVRTTGQQDIDGLKIFERAQVGGEIIPDVETGAKLQVNGFMRSGAVILHPHSGDAIAGAVQAANPQFIMLRQDGKLSFARAGNQIWNDDAGARSYLQSGYERLPSGLILQWGYVSSNAATGVTFPIAFPNGVLWGAAFGAFSDASRVAAFSSWLLSNTGMNITQESIRGGATGFRWMAIGT